MDKMQKALEAIRLADDIITFTRHDEYDIECTEEDYKKFIKLKNELFPKKEKKSVEYPKLYADNQTITSKDNLIDILNRIDNIHQSVVTDCLFLMYVGYGWGKFAFSVLSQGVFSEKQVKKIKEMVETVQNHEDRPQKSGYDFSDDDYEELDMVNWNGHGW